MPARQSRPVSDSSNSRRDTAPRSSPRTGALPTLALPFQRQAIGQSHRRCEELGLERSQTPEYCGPVLGAWRDAVERSDRLRHNAIPIMAMLYQQITRSESMVVLTDDTGLIIETVGDDDFLESAQKVALANGVTWSESAKGTNAIGTAIVDDAPTLVHAEQHFLQVNHFLTCSASPIHGPDGTIVGVLDVTGDQRSYHQHTMALVNMSTTMIENNLVRTSRAGGLRITLHRRPEFLSTLAEAIACTDANGMVVAANKVARNDFGLGRAGSPLALESYFSDLHFGQLVDLAAREGFQPIRLHLADGTAVFAQLEFYHGAKHQGLPTINSARVAASTTVVSRSGPVQHDAGATSPSGPIDHAVPAFSPVTGAADEFAGFETGDPGITVVVDKIRRVANRSLPIMIAGASGTGKTTLARSIHRFTAAADWHAISCLANTRLDGDTAHGVLAERLAQVASALQRNSGPQTVFFDKVDELSDDGQRLVLAWLDENGSRDLRARQAIRLVSAAKPGFRGRVDSGCYRADLYFRLAGLAVQLPALADRTDIAAISERIVGDVDPAVTMSEATLGVLGKHCWPGNIRELENTLIAACLLAGPGAVILPGHLPVSLNRAVSSLPAPTDANGVTNLQTMTDSAIEQVLAQQGGNISRSARQLGVSRNTIYRYLRRRGAT